MRVGKWGPSAVLGHWIQWYVDLGGVPCDLAYEYMFPIWGIVAFASWKMTSAWSLFILHFLVLVPRGGKRTVPSKFTINGEYNEKNVTQAKSSRCSWGSLLHGLLVRLPVPSSLACHFLSSFSELCAGFLRTYKGRVREGVVALCREAENCVSRKQAHSCKNFILKQVAFVFQSWCDHHWVTEAWWHDWWQLWRVLGTLQNNTSLGSPWKPRRSCQSDCVLSIGCGILHHRCDPTSWRRPSCNLCQMIAS